MATIISMQTTAGIYYNVERIQSWQLLANMKIGCSAVSSAIFVSQEGQSYRVCYRGQTYRGWHDSLLSGN
jgi:hypothetical protein